MFNDSIYSHVTFPLSPRCWVVTFTLYCVTHVTPVVAGCYDFVTVLCSCYDSHWTDLSRNLFVDSRLLGDSLPLLAIEFAVVILLSHAGCYVVVGYVD